MSYEPNIAPGDSGEYVTLLQERLQQLGYYEGSVDGQYGQTTETAVQQFQEATGLERDGQVQETTWQAIDQQHESLHGGAYQESAQETAGATASDTSGRQLSEDGQWWWDGTGWQAVDGGQATADAGSSQDSGQAELQLSPDGQYQWDGSQWLPVSSGTVDAAPQFQEGPLGFGGGPGAGGASPGLKTASTADALTGFEKDLADLLPEHMQVLDGIMEDLNAHPLVGGYITLVGGTDRRGDKAYNKQLGQNRAESVRQYLQARITDEETKQAIRAYSLGEPDDGPEIDDPNLRRVDITITRRTIEMPKPHPTDPLPKGQQYKLPDRGSLPGSWPTVPYTWMQTPALPPNKDYYTQLKEWLDRDVFNTDLERLGADIAAKLGQDRGTVRRWLDEAFKAGKDAAVKAGLQVLVDWLKGALSTPSPGPAQGPPDPIPFPDVPQGPTIRF